MSTILRLLFVVIPVAIFVGLIGLTYWGITTFISITGPVEQIPQDISIPSVLQGKVFLPKIIRNNSTPLTVELELSDLDRKPQEIHDIEVKIMDDCDYIEIIDGNKKIQFSDQGKMKEIVNAPISIRNIKPPIQCKVQIMIKHPNAAALEISKTIPVDAWTTKMISIISAFIGLVSILFSLKIFGG